MSGQKGAGAWPIPTLAFSNVNEFCHEVEARGLGRTILDAVRVQVHETAVEGGCRAYRIHCTTYDEHGGCILAVEIDQGAYGPEPGSAEEIAARLADREIMRSIASLHPRWVILQGEWVHDPVPPGLVPCATWPPASIED